MTIVIIYIYNITKYYKYGIVYNQSHFPDISDIPLLYLIFINSGCIHLDPFILGATPPQISGSQAGWPPGEVARKARKTGIARKASVVWGESRGFLCDVSLNSIRRFQELAYHDLIPQSISLVRHCIIVAMGS